MAAALLVSCSDDDSSSSVSVEKLVGKKWYYNSYKFAGQTIPYDDHEECGKDYIQFFANGTAEDVDIWDCEADTETGNFTLVGKTLTIVSGGDTQTATVKQLSSNKLILEATEDIEDTGNPIKFQVIYTTN